MNGRNLVFYLVHETGNNEPAVDAFDVKKDFHEN